MMATRQAQIAVDEVDNPWFSTAHPESVSNPRQIRAFRREDAVSAMRSLKPHQIRAADEFIGIWRTLHGLHGGSLTEHVDHHQAPSISDSVIDAGRELILCKALVGVRNYGLLEEVCGRGKSLTELFPVGHGSEVALVRLQRRIASHNIKTSLDDMARMWSYM
jgi:hypothetical protein